MVGLNRAPLDDARTVQTSVNNSRNLLEFVTGCTGMHYRDGNLYISHFYT